MPAPAARGLTAAELALALEDLRGLCPTTVVDAVALNTKVLTGTDSHDDVLLVLQTGEQKKAFVQVALGSTRARVTTTARRFGRDVRARGPGPDLLQRELQGATFTDIVTTPGERRCELVFETAVGKRTLAIELFSARGLWVLCDTGGAALTMSRAVTTAVRTLRRGDVYVPPPPAPTTKKPASTESRFAAPVLASIDAFFTELDLQKEQHRAHETLHVALERARKQARNKASGMRRQLDTVARSQEMRDTADLMLAYAHNVKRGAASMEVHSLDGSGMVTIKLDSAKPVTVQANQLYDKARKLDDGRAMTEQRLRTAERDLTELDEIAALLENATDEQLEGVRQQLQKRGLLPKEAPQKKPAKQRQKQTDEQVPFRRFTSAEGYPIFVGRNNNQNDELTMRYANGNDLWLHVGGGRPGSHVVVRLPKQKTASLETLLDAAALAVYYSKSRGEPRIEVVYTSRKNVRKPKGLPAGAVVPSHTKTLTVLADDERLSRLLGSSGTSGE